MELVDLKWVDDGLYISDECILLICVYAYVCVCVCTWTTVQKFGHHF